MAKLWKCQVKEDYKFPSARVSGRPFVKSEAVFLNDAQVTDEIKNSPVLDVEEVDDPDRPSEPEPAKKPARKAKASDDKDT